MTQAPTPEGGGPAPNRLQVVFADVVAHLIRSTSAATREHSRFERLLHETDQRLAEKVDHALLQIGRPISNLEESVQEALDGLRGRLLADLAAAHGELERLRATRHHATDAATWQQWADGVEMVASRLERSLERWGVVRIPTDRADYDVALHQVLDRCSIPGFPPDLVLQEVEPGYYFPETGAVLVRARVIVTGATTPAEYL